MPRGISFASLLLAWFCAQGALTETVQLYAWARMFAGYAQTMSWRAAVEETLDPNKPCAICCTVRKARETERKSPAAPEPRQLRELVLMLAAEPEPDLQPPESGVRYPATIVAVAEWWPAVPKPPPRSGVSLFG